ncbi:AraC family transcriptional regulator [Flammeovirga sp. SJP92]|uniref:helix-turn-helix domain-containing protein n=1 Tax=Flammeovirga sp. SJP92 TaxID=1775430 RepID=UPI0015603C91|nr:AraC family transcriptional regulator [Flammeovirga sp. SJP92]
MIERIWVLENNEEDIETYNPPSQYFNLIIPIEGTLIIRNQIEIQSPYLEGLSLQPSAYSYPKGTKLIGVRFYPYAIQSFFTIDAKKVINSLVSIVIDTISERNFIVDLESLLSNLYRENKNQELLKEFYWNYRRGDNSISIEHFCQKHNTNYTTLNRLFSKAIGISPKKLERLIKFRKSLCSLIDENDDLTEVGLDSGYFDQAHFIKEFKFFVGKTPSNFKKVIQKADQDTQVINYNFRLF